MVHLRAIGRAMNPYHTLGVAKGCTLDELKEAFRTRALLAHPDRGGEPTAFIQLRQAYDQIVNDVDARPPAPTAEAPDQPARADRRWQQTDPNWDPDLIVVDEPLPRIRPPRPPDPNWKADLIVLDEPLPRIRPPRPPDSSWEPELVIGGNQTGPAPLWRSPDPKAVRQHYVGWLRRVSARSQDLDPTSRGSLLNIIGISRRSCPPSSSPCGYAGRFGAAIRRPSLRS